MFECANHPGGDAAWLCNGCEGYFCDDCITIRRFGRTDVETCKGCGDMMVSVVAGVTVDEAAECPPLSSALGWPLQGTGPMILLTGTIGLSLVGFLSDLAAWGLMLGFGMSIIQESAEGRQKVPDWPDVSGWSDIIWPAVLGLATAALSFGPAIWLALHGSGTPTVALAAALGALYAPMAWMATSVSKRFLAITPLTVIPLLTRANGSYWIGCGFLFLALAVGSAGTSFLQEATPFPIGSLLGTAATFYLVMVEMRILGLIWFRHREDFGLD